jgi:hypothetical protein
MVSCCYCPWFNSPDTYPLALFGQVNLVLDDAVEFTPDPLDKTKYVKTALRTEILLNGNQIAAIVPGGSGPSMEFISSSSDF